jgi:hypothetical protein
MRVDGMDFQFLSQTSQFDMSGYGAGLSAFVNGTEITLERQSYIKNVSALYVGVVNNAYVCENGPHIRASLLLLCSGQIANVQLQMLSRVNCWEQHPGNQPFHSLAAELRWYDSPATPSSFPFDVCGGATVANLPAPINPAGSLISVATWDGPDFDGRTNAAFYQTTEGSATISAISTNPLP